ncbi:GNAT family N-acetyltransferase [Kineothrix sp. MSJ-39]|nr:GNAT family N-acetyltransferase [Kineothrix sp. MSJ-39]
MEIVDGKAYLPEVKELIKEYAERLGRDLSFQNIEDELKDPSYKYTAPEGEILVAIDHGRVLGMVAYHRHSAIRCEMKRLYVRPAARGMHLGDTLVTEILAHARNAGYKEIVLDTITPLKAAISLYKKHGFEECEAYYYNPMDDVIYMRKQL